MAKYIGLNTGFYLNDVNDLEESLSNLGINKEDLDHIRGMASAGITKQMFHLLGNLDLDQEKDQFSLYRAGTLIMGELSGMQDTTDGLNSPLRINNQLRAGAIKYNYLDESGATQSADISTSRISSWSQIGEGPIFYNADLKVNAYNSSTNQYADANKSVVKADNIIFKGDVTPRKFDAEVATHQITMNINGTDRKLFAMKNIPLTFEGFWQRGKIEYAVTSTPVVPAVEFVNENIIPTQRVAVFGDANTTALQEASFESTPTDKKLEFYYNPSGITQLKLGSMGIRELPDVVIKNLTLYSAPGNLLQEFPDFFKISGGYINGHNQNFRKVYVSGNPLSTSGEFAGKQLITKLPATVRELSINATFSDSQTVDISKLKTPVSIIFNPSAVSNNEIVSAGHGFQDGDLVIYEQNDNEPIAGLTDKGQYYIVNSDSDSVKLSLSSGGAAESLTAPASGFDFSITKLVDSELTHLYWDAYFTGSPGKIMTDYGVTPKVNANTISTYKLRQHRYSTLSYSVVSALKLSNLDLYNNNISKAENANGSFSNVIVFPNTNVNGVVGEHPLANLNIRSNNISVPDLSGKKYLHTADLQELYSSANPPVATGIEGYFAGCDSLQTLYLNNSYVTGRVNVCFRNLPVLRNLQLRSTRLEGRLSSDAFTGTTSLTYFEMTGGNHDFTDGNGVTHLLENGEHNFFENSFQLQSVAPPSGSYGSYYEGGYYAGVMTDRTGTLPSDTYYLVVADKSQEVFLPRYSGSGNASAGNVNFANGWDNTSSEAAGGTDYEAAVYAEGVTVVNGDSSVNAGLDFTDWYIPSSNELEVMYRNLKPDSSPNNTDGSNGSNLDSVPPYNASYSVNNPAQTVSPAFAAGGDQAFNTDTSSQYVLNGTFDAGTTNWSPYSGANLSITTGDKRLAVEQDGDGDAGVKQVIVLPKGTYDFSAVLDCQQTVTTVGDFVPGEVYEIVSVGSGRANVTGITYSNLDFANNEITSNGHPFVTGGAVSFVVPGSNTGAITGLSAGTFNGYTIKTGTNTFKLATSYANATAATPVVHEFSESINQTYTLIITGADGTNNYVFASGQDSSGSVSGNDPALEFFTGDTLIIDNRADPANSNYVGSGNHPLQFTNLSGVTVTTTNGISTITATDGTSGTFNYQCQNHASMGSSIEVKTRANNTYTCNSDHTVDWQTAGYSGSPSSGGTFTAANDGSAINSGSVTLYDSDAEAEQDKVVLTIATGDSHTAGDVLGTGEVLASQSLTPVSGTFALSQSTQIHVRVESHNCAYQIDNVSITNRTGRYWSSTSADGNANGFSISFIDGNEIKTDKDHVYYVRPVRRVPLLAGTPVEQQGSSTTFSNSAALQTFILEGKGKNASASSKNIRGMLPNVTYLSAISKFKITNTELTGQIPNFSGSQSLSELTLSNNKFVGTFTINNAFVDQISIDNNELSQVAGLNAASLWKFKANNNHIDQIVPMFNNCLNIQEIYLQDNQLKEYLQGSLSDCIKLTNLNLMNNQLSANSAERILRDLEKNYDNANRDNVNINLLGNSAMSLRKILENPVLAVIMNKLTSTANWNISINP